MATTTKGRVKTKAKAPLNIPKALTAAHARPPTSEEMLSAVLTSTPFNETRGRDLIALVTATEPQILDDASTNELKLLLANPTRNPQRLSRLLLDLQSTLTNREDELGPEIVTAYRAAIPTTLTIPPFSTQKATDLIRIIDAINPSPLPSERMTALYESLESPPVTQEDIFQLRELLTALRQAVRGNGDLAHEVEEHLPILLAGPEEITGLSRLRYDGTNKVVFEPSDSSSFYQALGVIMALGYHDGVKILRQLRTPKELYFASPLMKDAQDRYKINTNIIRTQKEAQKSDVESIFKCPRCHNRNVIYVEMQTRSADEPMTTKSTCLDCGKSF